MQKRKPKVVKDSEIVAVETVTVAVTQERETASVESFIEKALASGASVEALEKLLVMRKELKGEHAKEAFIAAMANFQRECPVIIKDKVVNDKYGKLRYKYAPMDSIVNQVREYIGKNGLSYTIDVNNENGILTAIVKITHILGHSETSSFQVPIDKDGFMSAPQKYAAASTFAKRYALNNALGILTGDEDTDAVLDEEVAVPTPPVTPPKELAQNNPALATYRKQLESCRTMDELGTAWANLPIQAKNALQGVKEELKAMISSEVAPA